MLPIDERDLRATLVNASRRELSELTPPADLAERDWSRVDYLGWRDPRYAKRAYLVLPDGDDLVGVVLRQADSDPSSRAQCSWCQDVRLPNDVVIFGARRSGHAGRNGASVAILVCSNFQCSANVRRLPPVAYLGFDVEAARDQRIAELRERVQGFARMMREGS